MPIEFQCQQCSTTLRVGDEVAGRSARCPRCSQVQVVPQQVAAADLAKGPPANVAGGEDNPFAAPSPAAQGVGGVEAYERQPFVPTLLDVGDVLNRAWRIFSEQIGPSLLAMLLYFVLTFAAAMVPFVAAGLVAVVAASQRAEGPALAIVIVMVAVFAFIIVFLILIWLQVGMTIYFLKMARGQDATMNDLFAGGPYLWRYAVVGLLYGLAVGFGMIFCIVPGVYLALLLFPCMYLVVDRNATVGEAFSLASQATDGNKLNLLLLLLIYFGISTVAGTLFSCIGTWLVFPFLMLMGTVAYLAMTGQPTVGDSP